MEESIMGKMGRSLKWKSPLFEKGDELKMEESIIGKKGMS